MTREKFRDYVESLRSQNEISYDIYSGLIDGIDTLEYEPKWIPVSERLPEEYERVIVFDVFGSRYIGEFIDAEESWGGKHFINEHGMHSKSVIAWMPLPKPYKAEDSDNLDSMLEDLWNATEEDHRKYSEVEASSSNFIQLKQDVLNNKQLWRKLREIKDEDSD